MLASLAAVVLASSVQLGASAGIDGELSPSQYSAVYGVGFGARVNAQLRLAPWATVGLVSGVSVLSPTVATEPTLAFDPRPLWMVPVAAALTFELPIGSRVALGISPRLGWLFTRGPHGPMVSAVVTGTVRLTERVRVGLELESQLAFVSQAGWPEFVNGYHVRPLTPETNPAWGVGWRLGLLGGGRLRVEIAF